MALWMPFPGPLLHLFTSLRVLQENPTSPWTVWTLLGAGGSMGLGVGGWALLKISNVSESLAALHEAIKGETGLVASMDGVKRQAERTNEQVTKVSNDVQWIRATTENVVADVAENRDRIRSLEGDFRPMKGQTTHE